MGDYTYLMWTKYHVLWKWDEPGGEDVMLKCICTYQALNSVLQKL